MIYFDSAATTLQKPESVYAAVQRTMRACASVGRGGHAAADAAELFDAAPEQVVFTMNATHGLNIALRSLVRPGGRVVLSGMEHNAVTRPLAALGAQIETADAPPFAPERLLEGFARALRQGADAAVCTHVSNVYGNVLPVSAVAALCRERGVPLVIDASQSAGTLPVRLHGTGAAFIAMPGHKGLYGPQGTGLLLCGAAGEPLLQGGTGLGKTYLSACIARVVAGAGYAVAYETAASAFDAFECAKFQRGSADGEAAQDTDSQQETTDQ